MGRPNAAAERAYSMAYRAAKRAARDAHIDRWLNAGMDVDEIVFACGYSSSTVNARLQAML